MTRADVRGGTDGTDAVCVVLPTALVALTGGGRTIRLAGPPATVRDALAALRREHPGVHARLVTEQGDLRPHVNVFVGREDIRRTGGLDTPLADGAELRVIPAVSGG